MEQDQIRPTIRKLKHTVNNLMTGWLCLERRPDAERVGTLNQQLATEMDHGDLTETETLLLFSIQQNLIDLTETDADLDPDSAQLTTEEITEE